MIEGLAESMSSLLKLFAGYLSDRLGKRKLLVVAGYSLASLARPLLGFTRTWQQVLAIRLTDRVGKGFRTAPRDAMIADTVHIEQRGIAFGFHRAMDHGGAVIGPLLGYLLVVLFVANPRSPTTAEFSWIFLIASVPALMAVIVAIFFMRESPVHSSEKELRYQSSRCVALIATSNVFSSSLLFSRFPTLQIVFSSCVRWIRECRLRWCRCSGPHITARRC